MAGTKRAARTPGGPNRGVALRAVLLLVLVTLALPAGATAEQASQPSSPAAGELDAGGQHTCALVAANVRCWGNGFSGQLGYGNKSNIGDNETPGAVGPVNVGPGGPAKAISAGDFHTCALLNNGSVRCWGFGGDGRLGYGNTADVGDNESPGSVGPVNLGPGRTATAISAGGAHTCAVLDDKSVRCWGFGRDGRLGYARPINPAPDTENETIGDNESPGSVAPLDLGGPATAISVGAEHTCALLEDRSVRCWGDPGGFSGGDGGFGRLGYPNNVGEFEEFIGDDETPASAGPVNIGGTAAAISAGVFHTCAVLDGGSVRCWGLQNPGGRLGYPNRSDRAVGDNETPASVGPVDLGVGRTATAVTAGNHTCARLDNGTVRCWGPGASGRLGYGNTNDIGDNEAPGSVGPVNLGGAAAAISAGQAHTCARLDDTSLRCWGEGDFGRLGYGNQNDIGDNETPAAAGPVNFGPRQNPPNPPNPLNPPASPPSAGCPTGTSAGVSCQALSGGGRQITGTAGNNTIVGTNANDIIRCGDGDDVVTGGGGDDTVNCGDGNDRVSGNAGNDRLFGEAGNDRLFGNSDNDSLSGGSGNDRGSGGSGRDRLNGNRGDDLLQGNSGNDSISGSVGRDRISGNSGNDRLSGNADNDRISGDSGRDRINGGSGRDRLSGASGNDSISARDRQRDIVSCGRGRDRVSADRRRGRDRVSRSCERVRRR